MTRTRIKHAQQRGAQLPRNDSMFQQVELAPYEPLRPDRMMPSTLHHHIPLPEVYVLDLSDMVFDALFGPHEGLFWAETTAEFPDLVLEAAARQ